MGNIKPEDDKMAEAHAAIQAARMVEQASAKQAEAIKIKDD